MDGQNANLSLGSRQILLSAILALSVAAVYLPVKDFAFTNWDDPEYLLLNQHVQSLTWDNLHWAFTHFHAGNYHPLTWFSHMLDSSLYGLDPRGHHLASLVFHIINVVLVFLVAGRLTGRLWPGFWLALLFGLHPMNVESAAWISERKNLLSTLFALLAIDAYREYTRDLRISKYLLVALFMLASLLCKPMMVTLPVLLLILDWQPLQRFSKLAVIEKIPLLGLAALCGLTTMAAQGRAQAIALLGHLSLWDRLVHVSVSYWSYAGKILWPTELSPYYPLPGLETADYRPWIPWLAGTALILVTAAAWRLAPKAPMAAAGWLWFLVSLLPVIGIIQVGAQGMADRYVYVPMLGLLSCGMGLGHFLCGRIGIADADSGPKSGARVLEVDPERPLFKTTASETKGLRLRKSPKTGFPDRPLAGPPGKLCHRLLYGCLACLAGAWAISSVRQLPVWKDSLSLWQHALPRCSSCFVVQYNLGTAYVQAGKYQQALPHLEAARAIRPDSSDPYVRVAEVHNLLGELKAADEWYQAAIERSPRNAEYHRSRGVVLARRKDWPAALAEFTRALGLRPDDPGIMADMVRAVIKTGDKNRARELLFKAMKTSPDNEELKELRTLVR